MSRHLVLISLLVALAGTAGCGADDLPPGSFLDRDRVLGARVEVADDPSRASPMPGEAATVRWIVAGPAAPAPQPWTLGVCAGTFAGCTAAPFQLDGGESVAPSISFTAPAADALGDATV
ncbi:MAG: hypothetical protein K8M05_31855, partial [Deltaproteobacteria bacterium]|nr:hypothetical protein [Kofleriaceae bacterium]